MFLMATPPDLISKAALKTFHKIDEIGEQDLAELAQSQSLFMKAPYLRSLEKAAPPGMSVRYVLVRQGKENAALFYFQIMNLSSKELGRIVHFEPYGKLLNSISGILDTFIFGVNAKEDHYLVISGNMCLSGDYGMVINQGFETDRIPDLLNQAMDVITKALDDNGKVVAWVVKDFEHESNRFHKKLISRRFIRLPMDPIMKMVIPEDWQHIQDYVNALSSKYRVRYNQTRKKVAGLTYRVLSLNDMDHLSTRIDELYKHVQSKSPVRIFRPDSSYLRQVMVELGDKCRIAGYFNNDQLIAFQCGIIDQEHFEAHHIGIDYHFNKSHSLYLNILFNYIDMAIDSRSSLLSFGRTALEMKTTVGAVPVNFDAYLKFSNRIVNSVCRTLAPDKAGKDWIPRNPFRE
jgi:hypothetical protein